MHQIRKIGPGFGIRGLNYAYFCDSSRVRNGTGRCKQAFHGFPERNKNLAHGGLYAQFSSKKSFEGGNEKYFGCAGLLKQTMEFHTVVCRRKRSDMSASY